MEITKQGSKIKIISGGQTGVYRAALDIAIKVGLEYGGFCPQGRLAEDGIIPEKYKLTELNSPQYLDRTLENVIIADGSLVIHKGIIEDGTLETIKYCQAFHKPYSKINLLESLQQIQLNFDHWVKENNITILNVAGPRESDGPIYDRTISLLGTILRRFRM